jgi:hypothetical protein
MMGYRLFEEVDPLPVLPMAGEVALPVRDPHPRRPSEG